jgi:protein-tyrosine phosphatase
MEKPLFEILVVCTGNICRSPAAEYLLREALDDSVHVHSAGTHGVVGAPVDPPMAAHLSMSCSGFAARQLTAPLVRRAGLVLGLTRTHRGRVVETFPAAVRRAFTLREFARILSLPKEFPVGGTAADFFTEAVPQAAALRSLARVDDPAEDDVADPYGQTNEVFADCFVELEAAVQAIAGRWRAGAATG